MTDTAPVAPALPRPKVRRRLRVARSLTREQVAFALNVTPETIRSWEGGHTTPRGRKRVAYARLLAALAGDPAARANPADHTGPANLADPVIRPVRPVRRAATATADGPRQVAQRARTEPAGPGAPALLGRLLPLPVLEIACRPRTTAFRGPVLPGMPRAEAPAYARRPVNAPLAVSAPQPASAAAVISSVTRAVSATPVPSATGTVPG
ncbi:helix-turn-helix transcriptional regulator, partial [Streptomyces sp. GC420]|uniref:helix-turn-helix transcriptional regulator n=1 Tax=Streptomyces sp. GC420 TaxID=2697568 RepID=UPI00141506CD